MLNVVIVEDEKHNSESLIDQLLEVDKSIIVMGVATSPREAIAIISEKRPDVVFMDIELHQGTGFDVLESLKHVDFDVIFTTAFEHYALKAIKFSSLDYLLKPIDEEELKTAIEKAKGRKSEEDRKRQMEMLLSSFNKKSEQSNICLSTSEGIEFIKIDRIKYCEANGSYTNFHLEGDQKLIVSKNLKEYESILSDHNFMRVHHSFLINLKNVKKYVKSDGGYILMNNNAVVSISPKRKDEFLSRMANLT